MFGLVGSEVREWFSVKVFDLGVCVVYVKEMLSDNNELMRYRTVMSGATMTYGGMASAGVVVLLDFLLLLLNVCICYIGMLFVFVVMELVVVELLYFGYE